MKKKSQWDLFNKPPYYIGQLESWTKEAKQCNKKLYWKYKIMAQCYIYLHFSYWPLTFCPILPNRHCPGRGACPLIYTINLISGQIMSSGIIYRTHPSRLSTCFSMCTGCLWLQLVMSIFLWNLSMVSESQAWPCRTCTINEIISLVIAADL